MASDLTKKIDDLSQKLAQLKAQKQQVDAAQKAKKLAVNRKADIRKKILLGAFVLDQIGAGDILVFEVAGRRFDTWLTRAEDLQLFNAASHRAAHDVAEGEK